MTVLVIDNDLLWHRCVRRHLRHHSVLSAGDPPTALELAKRRHPDVVLLEVILGYWNGLDLIRPLREILPEAHIAVVSALPRHDPRWAIGRGADAYGEKAVVLRRMNLR